MSTLPSTLKDFYLNEVMRNDVKTYLMNFLKLEAAEKAFRRESTEHIADAKDALDKAFDNLDVLFVPQSKGRDLKNEAR